MPDTNTVSPKGRSPLGASEGFVIELAKSLHAAGAPAHRLEELLSEIADRLNLSSVVFSTPTMLMLSFGAPEVQQTVMLRVVPVDTHLGRLDRLDQVARNVMDGLWTPEEGKRELERITQTSHQLPAWALVLTWLSLSAGSACFLGGGWWEMAVGAVIGAVIGFLSLAWPRVTTGAPVFELLAAGVAAFIANGAALWLGSEGYQVSHYVATLAGVVGLLPGMTLTVAVTEMATRHLASGSARATAAAVTLLQMGVGVALGTKIFESVWTEAPNLEPQRFSELTASILIIPTAVAVAFFTNARIQRLFAIMVVSGLGYFAARWGSALMGPELGAAVGSFIVGLSSRVHGIWSKCPQLLTLVPASLLLVPGSFGFRSVSLFLGSDVTNGIDAAMRMMLIAMSIAAGLLVAQALGRSRPTL